MEWTPHPSGKKIDRGIISITPYAPGSAVHVFQADGAATCVAGIGTFLDDPRRGRTIETTLLDDIVSV